jgi:enamine deaminase RidA (YjgF/YER057c/UK114 family)
LGEPLTTLDGVAREPGPGYGDRMASPTPRRRIASGSPYEPVIGFSRAVRAGERVLVAGTAPVWPDGSCDPDPQTQAARCLAIILGALAEAGAGPEHVVRTRVYATSADFFEEVARAHGEVFADIRPANAYIVVSGFVDPRWLVELEADAIAD